MAEAPPPIYLKRREEHRLRAGHPWIFSNEVDVARSPVVDLEPGALVRVHAHGGRFLATAYANPRTLICARILSRDPDERVDEALIDARIERAWRLRARLFAGTAYRLVHGESDDLPGLVVDRYHDVLVVQLGTAGIERWRAAVLDALVRRLAPAAVLLRNEGAGRALEGLAREVEVAYGTLPESVVIEEDGARFRVDPRAGQKTGWYLDQAANRARLPRYARGARVLDVFSYTGAWGIRAALAGAREVMCVDSSESALVGVGEHARLNAVEGRVEARRDDAFEALKRLRNAGERFGVVVLDPPAFIRRRKDTAAGLEAYRRLNRAAMQVLEDDAILVSASCSSHLAPSALVDVVRAAATRLGRHVQVLEQGHQGPDHPVRPGFPESEYLKVLFLHVWR